MHNAKVVNCWNSIGVWGREDPRCPLLEQVLHCHNCEKYIVSGRQALEREMPENYADEWSSLLSERKQKRSENTLSVVIFRLGSEWFSLPTLLFKQVAEQRVIHSIPTHKNNIVKGIVNVDGEIQLCFSLGSLLGISVGKEHQPVVHRGLHQCIVVVERLGKKYAFPVTELRGLSRYNINDLQAVPATLSERTSNYLLGVLCWEGLNVGCLNEELLFTHLDRSI